MLKPVEERSLRKLAQHYSLARSELGNATCKERFRDSKVFIHQSLHLKGLSFVTWGIFNETKRSGRLSSLFSYSQYITPLTDAVLACHAILPPQRLIGAKRASALEATGYIAECRLSLTKF